MADRRDLLVEIGTEELPPTSLPALSDAFLRGFKTQLEQARLGFGEIEPFATPRRLALIVRDLDSAQPDQEVARKGPALAAAYDGEGRPTKAAVGFARSCGVGPGDLQVEETPKGSWLVFRQRQEGGATRDLLVPMIEQALAGLPIPKRMRWGAGEEEFVRPVHWTVLLFGDEPVAGRLVGVETAAATRGHRFHSPEPIPLSRAADYADLLRTRGRVEPSFARRREMIREQVSTLAAEVGGEAVMAEGLLDEVTALCEWPTAILGAFDERYLEVPPEVLIETMQKNQKYFALRSPAGDLLPRFITIANIESHDPEQVRAGNERVIRPRFADAAFFWEQDLKQSLETYAPRLGKVVFQDRLGTVAEKMSRVGQICRHIAGLLDLDEELAARAAHLAKCDLMTHMIFEFGSLQGIMGRYYAERAGEDPCVSQAMEEQYLPRHAGDRLPQSACGRALSLADKLDTLVGIFAIGQRPTGVKDPYALRRAAIGVLRILIETPLPLDLKDLLEFTAEELRDRVDAHAAAGEVLDYTMERLKGYFQDRDIGPDLVDAVVAAGVTVPSDIHRRILAVREFLALPEAEALTAANKRIRNILKKAEEDIPAARDTSVPQEPAEERLAARIEALTADVQALLERQDYAEALALLAGLRLEVDAFFDEVMVMADDPRVRGNRLALLNTLGKLFLGVADISRLQQGAA